MRFSAFFFALTGIFFALLGAYQVAKSNPTYQKGHYSRHYTPGKVVRLLITEKVSDRPERKRFEAQVISVGNRMTKGKVFVTVRTDHDRQHPGFGDTLFTKKSLRVILPRANPGSFDYKSYALKQNVFHQIYLADGDYLSLKGRKGGLRGISVRINQRMQRGLEGVLKDADALGVAKALLLGYRQEISQDLLSDFKGAGAMHILAISGLHVGIILMILMKLTSPALSFKGGRQIQLIVVILGLWSYALVTGMTVSAVRAVSMFSLLALGKSLYRNIQLRGSLIISALVLLLTHPLYAFDVGFQLSYSALTGIALVSPYLRKMDKRRSRIRSYLVGMVVISCAAQLGVMPMSMMYFNHFSGLFLLSSLLLLPVLGVTLVMGYAVTVMSVVSVPPDVITSAFEKWMGLLNSSIQLIGGAENLIFRDIYFPLHFCALTYLMLASFFGGVVRSRPRLLYASGIIILSMQLLWLHARSNTLNSEELVVFHIWNESLILKRSGAVMNTSEPLEEFPRRTKVVSEYARGFPGRLEVTENRGSENEFERLFYINSALVYVLDSSYNAVQLDLKPQVLILAHSPRVNLERMLKAMSPEVVVADASNYPSFVKRWRQTCTALGIRFHATSDKRAFIYPTL